ncbi:Helix-turn-helix [Candidatus Aquiluna sp. UB-MaderosW2red]|nr:Helix-turn-helix [Candidatus Aquiluna sp. UB-MaderosW2red]
MTDPHVRNRIKLMPNQTLQQIIDAMTPLQRLALHNEHQWMEMLDSLIHMREAAGVSQEDLGRVCGVSQASISQLESSNSNPTIRRLLSHALSVGAKITITVEHGGVPMNYETVTIPVRSSKPGPKPKPARMQ